MVDLVNWKTELPLLQHLLDQERGHQSSHPKMIQDCVQELDPENDLSQKSPTLDLWDHRLQMRNNIHLQHGWDHHHYHHHHHYHLEMEVEVVDYYLVHWDQMKHQ